MTFFLSIEDIVFDQILQEVHLPCSLVKISILAL